MFPTLTLHSLWLNKRKCLCTESYCIIKSTHNWHRRVTEETNDICCWKFFRVPKCNHSLQRVFEVPLWSNIRDVEHRTDLRGKHVADIFAFVNFWCDSFTKRKKTNKLYYLQVFWTFKRVINPINLNATLLPLGFSIHSMHLIQLVIALCGYFFFWQKKNKNPG